MVTKTVSSNEHITLENLNLRSMPFEPQGEYLDNVSYVESRLRVNELRQCNEIIDMARIGGKLIAAVVRGEPSSGKTALAYKLKHISKQYHPKTEHIIVKMEEGSYDDPFFILSLIVDRLQLATQNLKQSKVDECLNEALNFSFGDLKLDKSEKEDLRKATRLMSLWYGYINALITVGGHDCVVIHIDEVEDRWASVTITNPQLYRDLKYLRDLLGYIQEGALELKFPVALLLYMTEQSYRNIGGVNNALKTRLERTILLKPFTEEDALELVKARLKDNRINNKGIDEYNPFTYDGILVLIKKSRDSQGLFSWRKFIINCHDILYYYNRRGGGIIDKSKVMEWQPGATPPGPGPTPPGEDPFDDIEFTTRGRLRADQLKEAGFLEDKGLQLQHAMENINRVLHDCSNHYATDRAGKVVFTIAGAKARVPISLRMWGESTDESDYFCIFITNKEIIQETVKENEFILKLPDSSNMMIRYALYDPDYLTSGELTKAKDQMISQVTELNGKLTRIFKKHQNDHYIPLLFGSSLQTEENFETLILELYNLSKCDIQKVRVDILTDWGFYNGANFTIPRWYTKMFTAARFVPKDLWEKIFFFNQELKPIDAAVKLLKKLEITDGLKLRHFEERRSTINEKIGASSKDIETVIALMKKDIGETHAGSAISKMKPFIAQLKEIKGKVTSLKATDNIFIDFMELYLQERHYKNVLTHSEAYTSQIKEISNQYASRKNTIDAAISRLDSLKIRNPVLENKLTESLKELNGIFERPDMIPFMRVSKPDYDALISEYNRFLSTSTQLTDDINRFNIEQLRIAAKKDLIDIDISELNKDWTFIKDCEILAEVEQKFDLLRKKYAELAVIADNHRTKLSTKFGEGKVLQNKSEQFLSKTQLHKVSKIIAKMGEKIEKADSYIRNGELVDALEISVDSDFEALAPTLKGLFKPGETYTIEFVQREFNLDNVQARNFLAFLEENHVLVATYKVAK